MNARLLILILAILIGGCATRGALDFDCPRFDTAINGQRPFRTVLPASDLERAIRGETITPEQQEGAIEARREEQAQVTRAATRVTAETPGVVALLLSGGGQWGAFGAGFMSRLLDDGRFPERPELVTGVSTGGLQALFVGAGLANPVAPVLQGRDWEMRGITTPRPRNYADLMRYEYRPIRESDVVNRNPKLLTVATGSMAGLRPLRRVIENALCTDPEGAETCMLDDLARSDTLTLIGFVDAEDGNFYYVNVNRIARNMRSHRGQPIARTAEDERIDPPLERLEAQQCIAAAALASVAMPAFFQQVRVNRRTYYDGGVRRSVFADYAAELAQRANKLAAASLRSQDGAKPAPISPATVHVLRNGPTSVEPDEGANENRRFVVDTALRAEQIVVNELEVGSVAGLRLDYPTGPLLFRSADAWDQFLYNDQALGSRSCRQRKGEGVMFDPDFMRCIMAYGYLVAGQQETEGGPHGWRILPGLPNGQKVSVASTTGTDRPKPGVP